MENFIVMAATLQKGLVMTQDKAAAPRGPERTPMPLRRETHVSPVSYLPRKIALALLLGVLLFLASSGPFAARQFPAVDEIADGPGTYDPGEIEPLLP